MARNKTRYPESLGAKSMVHNLVSLIETAITVAEILVMWGKSYNW